MKSRCAAVAPIWRLPVCTDHGTDRQKEFERAAGGWGSGRVSGQGLNVRLDFCDTPPPGG